MEWKLRFCEDVEKRSKKFKKRWPHELRNVFDNLSTMLKALNKGTKPEQLKLLGFVHSEPTGILAIDQSGPSRGTKPKTLRLYVFPHLRQQDLYVLILGDKDTQSEDIKWSKVFVAGLEEGDQTAEEAELEEDNEHST